MTTEQIILRRKSSVPVYVFTHGDLDGWMCALLAIIAYGWDTVVQYCNYNDIAEKINKFLDSVKGMKEKPFLLITDITPPKEVCERINVMAKEGMFADDPDVNGVVLIDHHDTVDWLDGYDWAKLDTSKCGAKLLFDLMIQNQEVRKHRQRRLRRHDGEHSLDGLLEVRPRNRELHELPPGTKSGCAAQRTDTPHRQ